ncbi:MAG: nucleoside triphosphate pyrophosphohydrolase [Xanthomonadales bacterium]|nr:nucleoside triphosphate pyrophosphohydrolase [Xanthomonadales bacterium]
MKNETNIQALLDIMARLRDPEKGCPWDLQQDFSTIAPYTIEEAYEVADAIQHGDMDELKDELGDLLFQVVFHAQMAQEQGAFTFADVADHVSRKMTFRHPHVFAREETGEVLEAETVTGIWEQQKDKEKAGKTNGSLLDSVPRGMAELQRAVKLQKKASKVGFDWGSPGPVLDKFEEEMDEMREAMASGIFDEMEDELGDLMFVLANLARQLKIDPAKALRRANAKFELRFRAIEEAAGSRENLHAMELDEMEDLWRQAKLRFRGEQEHE